MKLRIVAASFLYGYECVGGSEADSASPQWYLYLNELGSEDMTWHKWAPED